MKIQLIEPDWGKELLVYTNMILSSNNFKLLVPLLADGIVFTYPFLLIWFYYRGGIYNHNYKKAAFMVFFGVMSSISITLLIQQFISKARPEEFLDKNLILIDHLPSISFPSDHATVGFALAFGLIWSAKKLQDRFFGFLGYIFLVLATAMSIARVGAGVHRPTDILAGIVAALIGVTLVFKSEKMWIKLINFLIQLEEGIFGKFICKYQKNSIKE